MLRTPSTLFCQHFDDGPGPGWSANATHETTPNGSETILGRFGNEAVTYNLSDIADHTHARVAVDLHLVGEWVGITNFPGNDIGDRWTMAADGQTLIDTTFTNRWGHLQTYPSQLPSNDWHVSMTGSVAVSSLGYPDGSDAYAGDSTYLLERTFTHNSMSLELSFAAQLESLESTGETWGLDNLKIEFYTPDVTGDGHGDFFDMVDVLQAFGGRFPTDPGDVNDDGNVDVTDLTLVAGALETTTVDDLPAPIPFEDPLRNNGIAALLYNPADGHVSLDTDGQQVTLFALFGNGQFDSSAFVSPFGSGVNAQSAFEIGSLDLSLLGATGLIDLGALLPVGMSPTQAVAVFHDAFYVTAPGLPKQTFEVGTIPEPTTWVLASFASAGLLTRGRRSCYVSRSE